MAPFYLDWISLNILRTHEYKHHMLLIINAVSTGSKYFQVLGDVTDQVAAGDYLQVLKSTGNNGVYEIASVAHASGYSRLTTVESIPDATADGVISLGVYDLKFSQDALPGKQPIVIPPYGVDATTSLTFNGAAALNYGERQQENLLHLLENFASDVAPANPTIGQQWYDSTNDVLKTYTVTGWSTDINIEGGVISFKDPQHPTPDTKYLLATNEPTGLEGSGLSLYPEVNPSPGDSMFRVVDAAGDLHFSVEFDGETVSSNPLKVTSTNASEFVGAATINTSTGGTTGLTVAKNVVVVNGDLLVDTNKGMRLPGGGSVILTNSVTLRGTSTTAGIVLLSTGGNPVATFADASIVFVPATTIPTLTSTTITTNDLTVNNQANLGDTSTSSLEVTGTSTLNVVDAVDLTITGDTVLAGTTVASLNTVGTITAVTTNTTVLGVTGVATVATANVTDLTVTGTTVLASVTSTDLTATGSTVLASTSVTDLTATGTVVLSGTTVSAALTVTGDTSVPTPVNPTNIANKQYVDTLIDATEDSIEGGLVTQYWNGLKEWTDFGTSVRASILTGLSTATDTDVVATDTVLSAVGKLQGQLNSVLTTPAYTDLSLGAGYEWDAAGDGATYHPPGYTKVGDRVYLRGKVTLSGTHADNTTVNNTTIGTLPVGYRPTRRKAMTTFWDTDTVPYFGTCSVFINTDGTIVLVSPDINQAYPFTEGHVLLDQLHFDTL